MSHSFLDSLNVCPAVSDVKEDQWYGFQRLIFSFHGRLSYLVLPETPRLSCSWLWRPTFFGAWPETDVQLVSKGFYLTYTDVLDFYASPEGVAHGRCFYDLMRDLGLASRFSFVALSRGGLYAFRYAEAYPEQVAAIYADAPVCDVRSWPGGQGASSRAVAEFEQLLRSHGISEAEALAESFQPLYRLKPLADREIPLLHVCGDADEVVPFEENTVALAREYRSLGGSIEIIVKHGIKHHPHCLENPAPVVAFIEKHAG